MSSDKNDEDNRPLCRYGEKCYQKNAAHLNKYKHPPKQQNDSLKDTERPNNKRIKLDETPRKINNGKIFENGRKQQQNLLNFFQPSSKTRASREKATEGNAGSTRENSKNNINATSKQNNIESNGLISEHGTNCEQQVEAVSNNINGNNNLDTSCNTNINGVQNFDLKNDDNCLNMEGTEALTEGNNKENKEDNENKSKSDDKNSINVKNGFFKLNVTRFLKDKFLFDMPKDFYDFWELCKELNRAAPEKALLPLGLLLVGPYDVLARKFAEDDSRDKTEYLLHWRYFYDPPQMQTVVKGDDETGYHIGYFRDKPDALPSIMVENDALLDGLLQLAGDNIFGAVSLHLESRKKETNDPFTKMQLFRYQNVINTRAQKLGYSVEKKTKKTNARNSKIVVRTFNKIGLVVPYNKKTQLGYRQLSVSQKNLIAILTAIEKADETKVDKEFARLEPVLTAVNIATDECDFGTGIELGWNIICHGVNKLNATAGRLLSINYKLLKYEPFAKIAEAHMANRKKSCNLSIL